jgi:hypothetical protein
LGKCFIFLQKVRKEFSRHELVEGALNFNSNKTFSRFPAGARKFLFATASKPVPRAHPASYTMGAWILPPEVKRPRREAEYTFVSLPKL